MMQQVSLKLFCINEFVIFFLQIDMVSTCSECLFILLAIS